MGSKYSHLKPEEINDLRSNTAFSSEEIQLWYKGFLKDCPTGRLTPHEFKKIYKTFFPEGDSSSFSEHVFRAFDTNKDGSIDFHEFLCALSIASRGTEDEKLRWAFGMYDIDRDGCITRNEMLQIVTAIHKMIGPTLGEPIDAEAPVRWTNNIFKELDKNHDEKLSLDEFMDGAKCDPLIVRLLKGDATDTGASGGVSRSTQDI